MAYPLEFAMILLILHLIIDVLMTHLMPVSIREANSTAKIHETEKFVLSDPAHERVGACLNQEITCLKFCSSNTWSDNFLNIYFYFNLFVNYGASR